MVQAAVGRLLPLLLHAAVAATSTLDDLTLEESEAEAAANGATEGATDSATEGAVKSVDNGVANPRIATCKKCQLDSYIHVPKATSRPHHRTVSILVAMQFTLSGTETPMLQRDQIRACARVASATGINHKRTTCPRLSPPAPAVVVPRFDRERWVVVVSPEGRAVATAALVAVVDAAPARALRPHAARVIVACATAMSELEPAALGYLQFHADSGGSLSRWGASEGTCFNSRLGKTQSISAIFIFSNENELH